MSAAAAAASVPLFFGPPGHRLFGVQHVPRARGRRHAVVVCGPVGQEHLYAQRGLRRLAALLADEGFLTLRFDLSGTGDSEGEPGEAGVDRWQEDLARAAAAVEAQAGSATLCLVGLRLGAALAATHAAARPEVDALVLWEPVVDGREYVRELTARHAGYTARFPAPLPRRLRVAGDEALGLRLDDGLRSGLGAIDLRRLPEAPAADVLVVERERGDGRALADALGGLGARVTLDPPADEPMWIDDINRVIVPERAIRRIAAWVGEVCG